LKIRAISGGKKAVGFKMVWGAQKDAPDRLPR
jgi:hypothetical protein